MWNLREPVALGCGSLVLHIAPAKEISDQRATLFKAALIELAEQVRDEQRSFEGPKISPLRLISLLLFVGERKEGQQPPRADSQTDMPTGSR